MKPAVREEDALPHDGHQPLVVRLRPVIELSEDQLLELSGLNRDLPAPGTYRKGGANSHAARGRRDRQTQRRAYGSALGVGQPGVHRYDLRLFDRLHPP